MSSALDAYVAGIAELARTPDDGLDEVLNRLDGLWAALSAEERETVNEMIIRECLQPVPQALPDDVTPAPGAPGEDAPPR